MAVVVRFAETPEENEAVYQQRYRVYVEEMNLYQDIADHANRCSLRRSYSVTA